jgi:hypothetical protein
VRRDEAIHRIRAAARLRTLIFTEHAVHAMLDDAETTESVSEAIAHATSFSRQQDGTWPVHGSGLTAIVAVKPDVVVVTIFV